MLFPLSASVSSLLWSEKGRGEALEATIGSQYRSVLNIRDASYAHFGTASQMGAIRANTPARARFNSPVPFCASWQWDYSIFHISYMAWPQLVQNACPVQESAPLMSVRNEISIT
jgi:hypothetical protein